MPRTNAPQRGAVLSWCRAQYPECQLRGGQGCGADAECVPLLDAGGGTFAFIYRCICEEGFMGDGATCVPKGAPAPARLRCGHAWRTSLRFI